ncbi:MAG: UTP--glucose-1-phosphate uridylyltransferase [Pirellulales bacterium]
MPSLPMTSTQRSMEQAWLDVIVSDDDALRNRSLESLCEGLNAEQLTAISQSLDRFWRQSSNLYHRVRCLFFLAAIYRYHLPQLLDEKQVGCVPFDAYQHMLARRFVEAIDALRGVEAERGPDRSNASALAKTYHQLGIQTLADQVRKSVRTVRGNQWMFRIGHPEEHPLRLAKALLERDPHDGTYPILIERTSVRMDFTHSGWSDIFFLGMDFPDGARVVNASIDLAVHGRDPYPRPPVEAYLRIIDRPVLRLVSVDLGAEAEITEIDEVFDFAKDYLGLLKGAVIASGIVPPAMEGSHQRMSTLLEALTGKSGVGIEIVSQVNDIPKGSRLAVSTNLLGCLISVMMRATGQVAALEGGLQEPERRLVAARAILGEWLGGSGGGWQDSGGVWPGIKLIHGVAAKDGDPEFGVSRGRLLPNHVVLDETQISRETRKKLQDSLILVHGGMAQNVGPILEMVTEKYLLRSEKEWEARQQAIHILDQMLEALKLGDLREVGRLTTLNFTGPLQTIIPWCTNQFTNSLIEQSRQKFGERFWGFWMLGGMSGGGMGFIFDPDVKAEAQEWLQRAMLETKREMQSRLPFAMDPVVYDFAINDRGSWATLASRDEAQMPTGYYAIMAPRWIKQDIRELTPQTQQELMNLGQSCRTGQDSGRWLIDRLLPQPKKQSDTRTALRELLQTNGFDIEQHEQIRFDLQSGRIGLAQNRLPPQSHIEDVRPDDLIDMRSSIDEDAQRLGIESLRKGEVGVVTLAAGVGSRWTGGAGVVKGLHPFCQMQGNHRSFIEIHLAKSRKVSRQCGSWIPHVFTTGYMTHHPIQEHLQQRSNYGYQGCVYLSSGKSVGLRTIPMVRDLKFFWEEMPQQVLDEQQQKMRESARAALSEWARTSGEASDYLDNVPLQCMHPVGHWYEIPNLLRNGLLHQLLDSHPSLRYLLLHNIDTLGASVDASLLGKHIQNQACLSFEVIGRRVDDRGGGLALVDGKRRLLEGLAMPREEDEFRLTFYNSMTTWIDIDQLLQVFHLSRADLSQGKKVDQAVRAMAQRLPTYITIKDVKKRWGHGQEDVFPVTQFEKLWGDMTALPEVHCEFFAVEAMRGQQLKDPSQLDSWLRDGSSAYVENLCEF